MIVARRRGCPTALLLITLAATQCAAPPETTRQPPKIVFDALTYRFGAVEQGLAVAHAFVLRNTGGSNLTIDNVKSTCDCTAVMQPSGPVAPGATGTVQAKCDTAKSFGPRAFTVTVYSNDPAQLTTTLTLSGEITADVAADPPELFVGRARRGEQLDVPLRIVTGRGRPAVGLRLPKPDGPVLHASMPGPIPGQTERNVSLAIQATAPIGPFTEPLVVETSSAKYPAVRVAVTGIVDGDLAPAPRELRFGAVTRGDPAAREVIVRNRGDVPARVIGAELSQPIARAQIETVRDGREYRVLVSLYSALAPGRVQAQLKIQTNRPEQPEIVVPVSATIREKK
ncbi:MAG TPA: DUF1573 domain-containing protein [Candidatus Kryptonia bacterium]|nr:DUF1573 domain-containing protein [Candidatus Kryptonia bacterium]